MVDITLVEGSVFLSKDIATCGGEPHYHIVVHITSDNQIVVVHTTKEVEKTRAICRRKEKIKFDYFEPETLVIIDQSHCDTLTMPSAIDCNKAVLKPVSYFTTQSYFKICKPIKDTSTLDIIKNGIKSSDIVEEMIKNLF